MSSKETVYALLIAQYMNLRTPPAPKNVKLSHAPASKLMLLLREMVYAQQLAQNMTKMLKINAQLRMQLNVKVHKSFILMENAWLHAQNSMKILTLTVNALFSPNRVLLR